MKIYLKIHLDALQLAKIALEVAEKQFGLSHLHVAISLNNLATIFTAQGKYAEAEPLYKRALAILEIAIKDPDNRVSILTDKKSDCVHDIVQPVGELEIHQHIVPLSINIDKFGASAPLEEAMFEVTEVSSGLKGNEIGLEICPNKDYFARGQFKNLENSKKLSIPLFEKMDAGIALSSDKINFPFLVSYQLLYETNAIEYHYLATMLENMAECYKKIGKKDEAKKMEKRVEKIQSTL